MSDLVGELLRYTVPDIVNDKMVALISILDVLNVTSDVDEAKKLVVTAVEGTLANKDNRIRYFKNMSEYPMYSELLRSGSEDDFIDTGTNRRFVG